MNFIDIKLKPKEERRILNGHHWIFSNEIENLDSSAAPGSLCRILRADGEVLGTGIFNPHSLIAVRLIKRGPEPLEKNFVFESLDKAYAYRKELGVKKYGRMCYGEADSMPGLVIDRYGDVLVIDVLTAGMETLKDDITAAVKKIYKPAGIFYRNDSSFRTLENLPLAPAHSTNS